MRPGRDVARLVAARPLLGGAWLSVLALLAARGLLAGDARVWAYLVVALVLTAVVAGVDRHVGFSDAVLRLLALVGVLHLSGGLLPGVDGAGVLYDSWVVPGVLRFDQLVHFTGSAVGTAASWQVLGTWLDLGRTSARTQAAVAALAGLGKGALNEAAEFAVTLGVPVSHVGGFENTGWDLLFDVAGVSAAALFLLGAAVPRRPRPRTSWQDRATDRPVVAARLG